MSDSRISLFQLIFSFLIKYLFMKTSSKFILFQLKEFLTEKLMKFLTRVRKSSQTFLKGAEFELIFETIMQNFNYVFYKVFL